MSLKEAPCLADCEVFVLMASSIASGVSLLPSAMVVSSQQSSYTFATASSYTAL